MVIRETDRWEVRCWYKHSDIPDRIKSSKLKPFELRRYPAGKDYGQAPNAETVVLRWDDPETNKPFVVTHHYELPGGRLGASGELDPTRVFIGGTRYDAHDGPDKGRRDLCDVLPKSKWIRQRYGDLRKLICDRAGPVWAARFSKWGVPVLRPLIFSDKYFRKQYISGPLRRAKSRLFSRIKKPFYLHFG